MATSACFLTSKHSTLTRAPGMERLGGASCSPMDSYCNRIHEHRLRMGVLCLHQTEHKEGASAEGGAPCQGAAHGAGSCQVGRINRPKPPAGISIKQMIKPSGLFLNITGCSEYSSLMVLLLDKCRLGFFSSLFQFCVCHSVTGHLLESTVSSLRW